MMITKKPLPINNLNQSSKLKNYLSNNSTLLSLLKKKVTPKFKADKNLHKLYLVVLLHFKSNHLIKINSLSKESNRYLLSLLLFNQPMDHIFIKFRNSWIWLWVQWNKENRLLVLNCQVESNPIKES